MKETFSPITADVDKSAQHGRYAFPARQDYEQYFLKRQLITTPDELWDHPELVIAVQRHWHSRGQNGCVFAQVIASDAAERGWESLVVSQPVEDLANPTTRVFIETAIQTAIASPKTQILSLLFPQITDPQALARLVQILKAVPSILVADEKQYADVLTIALRVVVAKDGALSWLMGFGPFDFLPNTRQAPVTEVAIRAKPKPEIIFHRLNQDQQAAHLADTPTATTDVVSERLWQATLARTRGILQGEPNQFSAAKVTFTIPNELLILCTTHYILPVTEDRKK